MSHKIYIIEDEAIAPQDLKVNLEHIGFQVLGIAHNCEKALLEIARLKPDLVLSTIGLSGNSDGIALVHKLNNKLAVPVILICAYFDKDTLSRAKQVKPQGYLIQPINQHQLEITIELAINDFSKQQKSKNQQIISTALACVGESILLIDVHGRVKDINNHACQLLSLAKDQALDQPWHSTLICSAAESTQRLARLIDDCKTNQTINKILPVEISHNNSVVLVDGIIAPIVNQEQHCSGISIMLRHLTSPADAHLSAYKNRTSDHAIKLQNHACLVLINPDNFELIVKQWQHQVSDTILSEISGVINKEMRVIDLATRYGGAVFSATLPNTSLPEALIAVKRIQHSLGQHKYHNNQVSLTFSVGIAALVKEVDSSDIELPITLFRHATWALNAAHEAGGDCIRKWQVNGQDPSTNPATAVAEQSQSMINNDIKGLMLLLNTIALCSDLHSLSMGIISNLMQSMTLVAGALWLKSEDEPIELIVNQVNPSLGDITSDDFDFTLSHEIGERMGKLSSKIFAVDCPPNTRCYVMPLFVDNHAIGLVLLYRQQAHLLKSEQISALETLSGYLAVAIDRVLLAAREQGRIHTELQRFEGNVIDSQIIFQSEAMGELIQEVKMLAPTDAPVMITGESGTGKELLARMIHKVSLRQHKPFVIVDCAAIVPSLMASELFGHKKGAFTNASESHLGKFKQADTGTLFLDEIGELPLDLQIKLLRFAQEKTFSSVGSNQVETVDVRLIVATNRNLAIEVDKGRFRKDLFYRLNVFTLHSPSLRQRSMDILLISEHYLCKFNQHYHKNIKGFSQAAARAMTQYDWPGNVRELRNQLMRAVIMCNNQYIDVKHLNITALNLPVTPGICLPFSYKKAVQHPLTGQPQCRLNSAQLQAEITNALSDCISILQDGDAIFECGKWLENEFIRLAKIQGGGNISQSARLLGLPEATLRRRIETLNQHPLPPLLQSEQKRLVNALTDWLEIPAKSGVNKLQTLRLLLSQLAEKGGMNRQNIALFVGVSIPTLRKLLINN